MHHPCFIKSKWLYQKDWQSKCCTLWVIRPALQGCCWKEREDKVCNMPDTGTKAHGFFLSLSLKCRPSIWRIGEMVLWCIFKAFLESWHSWVQKGLRSTGLHVLLSYSEVPTCFAECLKEGAICCSFWMSLTLQSAFQELLYAIYEYELRLFKMCACVFSFCLFFF